MCRGLLSQSHEAELSREEIQLFKKEINKKGKLFLKIEKWGFCFILILTNRVKKG